MTLQGQRVLVFGGTAGIGLATARMAHAQGAEVIVTGRNESELRKVAHQLGERTRAERLDATQPDQLVSLFGKISRFDHLVLSVSAGPTGAGPIGRSTSRSYGLASKASSGRSLPLCTRRCRVFGLTAR